MGSSVYIHSKWVEVRLLQEDTERKNIILQLLGIWPFNLEKGNKQSAMGATLTSQVEFIYAVSGAKQIERIKAGAIHKSTYGWTTVNVRSFESIYPFLLGTW